MVVAMARDIRVLLIKLCDRLDNMRTLEHMKPEAQERIARETLEIYAPLANRLGIQAFKSELEDLSFKLPRARRATPISSRRCTKTKRERDKYITEVCKTLSSRLAEQGFAAEVTGRAKHLYSDLPEDEGAAVGHRAGPRPHRVPRRRRERERLLRRARRHPLAVDAGAGPLQGLHRAAQAEHVPVAAHDGHRPRARADRDPDPHPRDAPRRRARHRGALEVQGAGGGGIADQDAQRFALAAAAPRVAEGAQGPGRVPRGREGRPLPGRGLRLHARRATCASSRAGATPIDFAYQIHTQLGEHVTGRAHQRQDRAAPLQAAQRRRRRGPDAPAPAPEQGLARLRRARCGPARRSATYLRAGAARQEQAPRRGAAREGAPHGRASARPSCSRTTREMRRVFETLKVQNLEELFIGIGYGKIDPEDDREARRAAGRGGPREQAARVAARGAPRGPRPQGHQARRGRRSASTGSTTSSSATPSAATPSRATTSSASSRAGAASPSTAAAVRRPSTPIPSAASRSPGTARRGSTGACSSAS